MRNYEVEFTGHLGVNGCIVGGDGVKTSDNGIFGQSIIEKFGKLFTRVVPYVSYI